MISIITLSCGREHYVMDLIDSIMINTEQASLEFMEHLVFFQGCKPSEQLQHFSGEAIRMGYPLKFIEFEENEGIGFGLNKAKKHLHPKSQLVMKADEDCVFRSPNFVEHAFQVMNMLGEAIISPYPVGLIGNPGGPPKLGHHVIYSELLDTHYTLRKVNHVGGFARICPTKLFVDFEFPYDKSDTASGWEDGHFSRNALAKNIPMYYLENALIVEHNESTLGQHQRYGEAYFKGRM